MDTDSDKTKPEGRRAPRGISRVDLNYDLKMVKLHPSFKLSENG